jgi:hypothetical protein
LRRFWGETRGREERRRGRSARGLYRRGYVQERLGFWRGGDRTARVVPCSRRTASGGGSRYWQVGHGCQRGGVGEASVPLQEFAQVGRGPEAGLGRIGSPGLFSFSILFFFWKLFYFITFSFVLQFDSNQFVKFSKIQENIPDQ